MSTISVKIKNERGIVKALKDSPKTFAREFRLAFIQIGEVGVKKTKEHITRGTEMWKPPIDTGLMRRGIHTAEVKPFQVIIKPSQITDYAKYVHDGTRRMRARPFFEITARNEEKNIGKLVNKAIDSALKRIAEQIK